MFSTVFTVVCGSYYVSFEHQGTDGEIDLFRNLLLELCCHR
jgi:hypothetical protein